MTGQHGEFFQTRIALKVRTCFDRIPNADDGNTHALKIPPKHLCGTVFGPRETNYDVQCL